MPATRARGPHASFIGARFAYELLLGGNHEPRERLRPLRLEFSVVHEGDRDVGYDDRCFELPGPEAR